jgi:NAD-dependent DNA ligase
MSSNLIPASQFLKKLSKIQPQDLVQIKGIGEVLAQNLDNFLKSKRYLNMLEKFEKMEVLNKLDPANKILEIDLGDTNQGQIQEVLSGQIICITGTFSISRNEIIKLLEGRGAKVVDSISKTTTIPVSYTHLTLPTKA